MKLNVKERFALLALLPQEGKISVLRSVNGLRDRLPLTDAEVKQVELQEVNLPNGLTATKWNPRKDFEADFDITPVAAKYICGRLLELHNSSKLTPAMVSLWDKFEMKDPKEEE